MFGIIVEYRPYVACRLLRSLTCGQFWHRPVRRRAGHPRHRPCDALVLPETRLTMAAKLGHCPVCPALLPLSDARRPGCPAARLSEARPLSGSRTDPGPLRHCDARHYHRHLSERLIASITRISPPPRRPKARAAPRCTKMLPSLSRASRRSRGLILSNVPRTSTAA